MQVHAFWYSYDNFYAENFPIGDNKLPYNKGLILKFHVIAAKC